MDEELKKLIVQNNELLKESIELSKSNQKRIKKIHAYIRRTFVAKIIYWVIIILVAAGAFYAIKPRINNIIDRYKEIQVQFNKRAEVMENTGSLIEGIIPNKDDLRIINILLGS